MSGAVLFKPVPSSNLYLFSFNFVQSVYAFESKVDLCTDTLLTASQPCRKLGVNDVQGRHYLIAFANIYYFLAILLLKYLVHTSGPNKARVLQQLWHVCFDGKTYSLCYIIAVICKMFACYIQNTLFVLKKIVSWGGHYINQVPLDLQYALYIVMGPIATSERYVKIVTHDVSYTKYYFSQHI